MNTLVLLFIFAAIVFPYAEALQCYACLSTHSWEDCDDNRINGTCAAGLDKCAKVYAKGANEAFIRGCESSYQCTHKTACDTAGITECELHCCDGNFCNSSPANVASAFFLAACAMFALLSNLAR